MRNVLTWHGVLDSGFEPSIYQSDLCPFGYIKARLDFKVWTKNAMGVTCYFTEVETNRRFILTCFRLPDKTYRLREEGTDFTSCPTGVAYGLRIEPNGKGRASLKDMNLME